MTKFRECAGCVSAFCSVHGKCVNGSKPMPTDELVERARYCHEHGIFDASHAGKMVSYGELADRIEALTAEVRRLDYSTTHTCWDECPRLPCAQRREIEALTAQLATLTDSDGDDGA